MQRYFGILVSLLLCSCMFSQIDSTSDAPIIVPIKTIELECGYAKEGLHIIEDLSDFSEYEKLQGGCTVPTIDFEQYFLITFPSKERACKYHPEYEVILIGGALVYTITMGLEGVCEPINFFQHAILIPKKYINNPIKAEIRRTAYP